jgi:hypothetical protein
VLLVGPIGAALAFVFARRSRRELGYRSGRTIAALVIAWVIVVFLIFAATLYLLAIWIGHSNFG